MPMNFNSWTGHVFCCRNICANDPFWLAHRTAYCSLQGALIGPIRWSYLLTQGHHWWRELDLWLWLWDKAIILLVEESSSPGPKKMQQVNSKDKSVPRHFLWCQGNCAQNSSRKTTLPIPRVTTDQWKSAKTAFQTSRTIELAVTLWQCILSHPIIHRIFLTKNNMVIDNILAD